ncbi:hypothetical protein KL930_001164 [Ogataea haglerorum]|uniref:M7GpppX diphosphatase n=1 Tax=Ogataea haglerorum TaxID=1937702 RepID=A0AAN6D1K2_9ASCO|nr:hypothetical protein KL915_005226 [Ogataea haglerorum]KAG7706167.1 hypothetical protein KL914_003062 [Ogataea haglerorum]KAG7708120.1 hypothetical protein KL950_002746 [Ogataea haglerorum]KAG7714880.1 hypothetical protein KL913_004201 [Ogataea haglerorum]KAG7719532.1 hypothetical protein KL949_002524 [Ogataea haglerorum]
MDRLVSAFQFERLLSSDSQLKTIALLGTIDGRAAILQLEKSHFDTASLPRLPVQEIREIASNDVYHWAMTTLQQSADRDPAAKLNLIYPASETHIRKYEKPVLHIVRETPELYRSVVLPYIETMRGDVIKWVRNILYEGAEADRVVVKNDDFVLLPDMKWDGTTLESLYLCCIVYRDDIASIRDLNETHIPYLERIAGTLRTEIPRRYSIAGDQLRIFVHYQPSYYHFHLHVVNTAYHGLGESILAGRAILLEEVIDTLRFLGPEGYQRRTLTYAINESHKLWELGLNRSAT